MIEELKERKRREERKTKRMNEVVEELLAGLEVGSWISSSSHS